MPLHSSPIAHSPPTRGGHVPTTGYMGESEVPLQKRSHRPLHAQVATLLAEREELLAKNRELATANGDLQWRLANAMEDLNARKEDSAETVQENLLLEVDVSNYKETSEVFALAHAEAKRLNHELRQRLKASDNKCRHVLAQLMHTSTALQAERTLAEGVRAARRVETATLIKDAEVTDAELDRLQVLLLATMGERQWLRDQLASVLQRQLTLRKRAATERAERTELMSQISGHLTDLEAERRERAALADELERTRKDRDDAEAALRRAEERCDALYHRAEGAQTARVASLVSADRAESRLAEERRLLEEVAATQRELSAYFAEGAAALATSARVAEEMRWTHTTAERCALVEKAWLELLNKGRRRGPMRPVPVDESTRGASTWSGNGTMMSHPGPGTDPMHVPPVVAPSTALATSAASFASASLALVRAMAPLPSGTETLPSYAGLAETRTAAGAWGDSVGFAMGASTAAPTASPQAF